MAVKFEQAEAEIREAEKELQEAIATGASARRWYKCELMGISASSATDIRLSDPACGRWEKKKILEKRQISPSAKATQ